MFTVLRRVVAKRTDQTRSARLLQREHSEKVRLIEVDVQFGVHGQAGGLDVRNIEKVVVGSPGESRAKHLPDPRAGAIAAGEICKASDFLDSGFAQRGSNLAAAV